MPEIKSPRIGRQRDRILVAHLLEEAKNNGGILTEDGMVAAVRDTQQVGKLAVSREAALNKVRKKLANPNIRAAIGDAFREAADFDVVDAIQKHVEHIKGAEYDKVLKDGSVVKVKDKPSFTALKAYEEWVLPIPAKRVDMGIAVGMVGQSMLESVPEIEARAIGPAVVEAAAENVTVELQENG